MQVEWLTAAEDDLREIARRVELNFGYVTAERTVANVTEETQRLADFSEIGRLCDEYDGSRRIYCALNTRKIDSRPNRNSKVALLNGT